MQDKWMNIGHQDEPLKPFVESPFAGNDDDRLRKFDFVLLYLLIRGMKSKVKRILIFGIVDF